ncbi:hypothetical protein JCM5350_002974 [Sporobolomyces pararoseus]
MSSSTSSSTTCPITLLPLEILLEILSLAASSIHRNSSLISLATVCKTFKSPALRILFERLSLQTDSQAREYLKTLQRSSKGQGGTVSELGSLTRRLSISYTVPSPVEPVREGEGGEEAQQGEEAVESRADALRNATVERAREIQDEGDQDGDEEVGNFRYESEQGELAEGEVEETLVKGSDAMKIFFSLNNLTSLSVECEDEFGALFSSLNRNGGRVARENLLGRVQVVKLVGSKIRWDRLIQLLDTSKSLRELQVEGLYEAKEREEETEQEEEATAIPPQEITTFSPQFPISLERPASPLPRAPFSTPRFPRFDHLVRLRLDSPSLSDQLLLSLVGCLKNSLESFALTNSSSCLSREGLIIILRNLTNLFELELSDLGFVDDRRENVRAQMQSPTQSLLMESSSSDSGNASSSRNTPLVLPSPRSLTTDQLDPYSFVPFSPSLPITLSELRSPIDYLPLYCPFLQSLTLTQSPAGEGGTTSPPLVSRLFFEKSVTRLPLQYLTLGITESRRGGINRPFPKELIVGMIEKIAGRLEALAITQEMMWEENERDWLRTTCSNFGIVYTAENSSYPRRVDTVDATPAGGAQQRQRPIRRR